MMVTYFCGSFFGDGCNISCAPCCSKQEKRIRQKDNHIYNLEKENGNRININIARPLCRLDMFDIDVDS